MSKKFKYQVFIPVMENGSVVNVVLEKENINSISAQTIKEMVMEQIVKETKKDERDLYHKCLTVLYEYLPTIKKGDILKDEVGYSVGNTPNGRIFVDKWVI